MYCVRKMTEDLYWVGASERRLNLFENAYPLTNGVSYNSYLLLDEKTVLIDTVDKSVSGLFFENVDHVLGGRKLDYLIVQHMEPDHAATIGELVLRHPEVTIVCNAKTRTMMQNFFTFDIDSRRAARQGNGHAHDRQAYLRLRHGPNGPLAGGHGLLRHNDQNALFGRRLRHLRRAERQSVRRRGQFPDRMARRCPPVLYQHRRQIRHAGAGAAQKGRGA